MSAGSSPERSSSEAVLRVRDLRVAFETEGALTPVLHGVDLEVAAGECVAVVGASGAGKSVLARSLLGLAGEGGARARVSAGELRVDGVACAGATERAWRGVRGRRVGLVLQDALGSLDPLRTIGAEVGESLRLHTRAPRAARSRRVVEALRDVGLPEPGTRARQRSGELSGGMRQRALIASALVTDPPLLVLDEPTTALDATIAAGVLDLLARQRDAGTGMLLVTHDLGVVARIANRVIVLEAGRVVEEGPTARVLGAPKHRATRALLAALPRGPKPGEGPPASTVVLSAEHLVRRYPVPGGRGLVAATIAAVDDVTLALRRGEMLGIVGESGSGKSTLARLLLAAEPTDGGEVRLDGGAWSAGGERRRRAARSRIRMVPQDPLGAMDPRRTVGRILRDAGARDEAAVAALLRTVHLETGLASRMPRSLSGGQRQRVAIARALASDPEVLILDEPVSALDVAVQAGILDLLGELQRERGAAMVLISHDLAVVRRTCDRVAVMSAGRIVETGPTEQVWAQPQHEVTRALLAATAPLP
ncbi:nickel ABC transporter ATP-binding protein NikE [Serinibacter salmoneus]|uniref:Peptide/nickel transport system ATP-binding protein n=1 Tax=Serinibacter salmoneus TaxID=556530 RepID=A0A2A9D0K6_9MICO|nr:ABC transporter ATP-binding protein [Serinibacter salmoneus]PFG20194.1 peptide/nickel transport system ATP-binding protein [Serinibacter salmoneus]